MISDPIKSVTHLDEAVEQVRTVFYIHIHVCEKLAKAVEYLVEIRQYVASRNLSPDQNAKKYTTKPA